MADMKITLQAGRADAVTKNIVIPIGGDDAPSPFDLFVASLGSCAALTAAGYCKSRGLDSEGLQIVIDIERNPKTRLADKIEMEIILPAGIPQEHHNRILRAAEACFVKKHLYEQPEFVTTIRQA